MESGEREGNAANLRLSPTLLATGDPRLRRAVRRARVQLTIPLVLARAIDVGIVGGDGGFLVRAAGLIVGLTLLQGCVHLCPLLFVQALAERVAFDLRNELYTHLQGLPFAFYDRAQTGQLMSRATDDINNIRAMLVMACGRWCWRSHIRRRGCHPVRIDRRLALVALAPMPC